MLLLATVDLIVLFFMLRSLWRNKWKKRFVKWGQKTFENIAKAFLRFVERFLDKLGFSGVGDKNTIHGKVSVVVDKDIFLQKVEKKQKNQKWKQMKNNKERLGFLYKYMIVNRIKKGKKVFASDTPSEIREKYECADGEYKLFDLYINTRYDDREEPSDEEIDTIKRQIEKLY